MLKMHEDRSIKLDDTVTYIDHNGKKVKVQKEILKAPETPIEGKSKPDHSKREIDLGHKIVTFNRAEYTNSERTTMRIFYEDDGGSERLQFDFEEQDPSRAWLVEQVYQLTDKDEIMENTYQRIKAEEASFKEFAIRLGKEEGYLIDPIAYYDSESNSAKVDTKFYTHAIKLFFGKFDEEKQKEDLFVCKLAAFELDMVQKSEDKDIKSKLRKAKSPLEVIQTLLEIKQNSEV
mgnify:CR=1 FL=1